MDPKNRCFPKFYKSVDEIFLPGFGQGAGTNGRGPGGRVPGGRGPSDLPGDGARGKHTPTVRGEGGLTT